MSWCPNLDVTKIKLLPRVVGPSFLSRAQQDTVQSLVDIALDTKNTFRLLRSRQGDGDGVVRAKYDNQVHTLRLPPVDNMMALETYLHLLMDDLGCCSNFVSTTADVVNHQCNSDFSVPQTNTEKSFKRRGARESLKAQTNGKSRKISCGPKPAVADESVSPTLAPVTSSSPRNDALSINTTQLAPESNAAQSGLEFQRATSTTTNIQEMSPKAIPTSPRSLPIDPAEWSIDDVMQYLSSVDSALNVHAQLFHKHEIDGKALLLLTSDMMMKYMGLKLGPSLKICNIVNKLKGRRHVVM